MPLFTFKCLSHVTLSVVSFFSRWNWIMTGNDIIISQPIALIGPYLNVNVHTELYNRTHFQWRTERFTPEEMEVLVQKVCPTQNRLEVSRKKELLRHLNMELPHLCVDPSQHCATPPMFAYRILLML